MKLALSLMTLTSLILVAGCITTMPTLAVSAQSNSISLARTGGEDLFVEKCGMCHRADGMGTGILARRMSPELALLENRKDLAIPYISNVVRNGFVTMFPLSRAEVSDGQLTEIADYLGMEDSQ